MGFSVQIDGDFCLGSGTCVAEAPNAFAMNEQNVAEPKPGVSELTDERLLRICKNCPAGAIVLHDEDGREVDVLG